MVVVFFFSSRRRHTRYWRDWSSDVCSSDLRAVVLTTFGRQGFLRRAMEVGAAGVLVNDAPVAELARSIRAVMAGERVIGRDLGAGGQAVWGTARSPRVGRTLPEHAGRATVAQI